MASNLSATSPTPSLLASLWEGVGAEVALLLLFCAGFFLFRTASIQRFVGNRRFKQGKQKFQDATSAAARMMPAKHLEANWAAGHVDVVLSDWSSLEFFTLDAFKSVVEALVASSREHHINSVVQQILAKHDNMCSKEAMSVALDALQTCPQQISGLVRASFSRAIAKDSKSTGLSQEARSHTASSTLSPAEHSQMMRIITAAQSRDFHAAKQQMLAMREAGYKVPASCFVMFARSASDSNLGQSLLESLPREVLTVDAIIALLEHATKSHDSKLTRDLHQQSDEMAFLQVPAVCEALLKSYAAQGDSRAVEVFEDLVSKGFSPSEAVLSSVISLCAESRHVQMAEHALKYARRVNANLTLTLYAAMVKVYGHARLFDQICNIYELMRQDGIEPDTAVYGALIKAAVESGRLDLARQLFRESGNPDLLNYMSLIRAAGREKDLPKALGLLEELEGAAISVDTTAYNCVLEVAVASGDRAAATKLLKRMESKGQVDIASYNTYMKLLFANGEHLEIKNLLQSMKGRGLHANAVTYNSLIKDAIMRQDLQAAWDLTSQMEGEGTNPDAYTCSILLKGAKHSSSSADVDKIVNLMQRTKVIPDEVLVNCLLEVYVRLRNIPRLVQILEEFKSTGVVPSLRACALLIKAYGHSRRLDCAWTLWNELINERKVTPNEEVFASMVDACLAAGDLENAVAVFREMRQSLCDFYRGPAVFAGLVKACISRKQTKLAMEIYDEMHQISFTPNRITYNTIIDALVRQGDVDKATAVFRDMSIKAVTPDLISYATLIKGHCARGCLDEGLRLLGLMQRQGISPDAIVFNSILDGCAHKQMRTLTEQVLKDMENAGIAPSNFTLSILVKLYGRCSDLDTAFNVVKTYPHKYKFKLNMQVYTCLMSACIANGSLSRALGVYSDMAEAGCAADAKMYQTLLNGCLRHGDLDAAAKLVNDALEKKPSPCLDREMVEPVLFMMASRGRGADLGRPLLEQLMAADIRISDRVRCAVLKADAPRPQSDATPRQQHQQARRPARASA